MSRVYKLYPIFMTKPAKIGLKYLHKTFLNQILLFQTTKNYFSWLIESCSTFKGGFKSEDTEKILLLQKIILNIYPEQKIWISCLLIWAGNSNFLFRIVIWNIFFG